MVANWARPYKSQDKRVRDQKTRRRSSREKGISFLSIPFLLPPFTTYFCHFGSEPWSWPEKWKIVSMLWGQNGKHFEKSGLLPPSKRGFSLCFPSLTANITLKIKISQDLGLASWEGIACFHDMWTHLGPLPESLCSVSETKTSHTNPLAQRRIHRSQLPGLPHLGCDLGQSLPYLMCQMGIIYSPPAGMVRIRQNITKGIVLVPHTWKVSDKCITCCYLMSKAGPASTHGHVSCFK